MPDLDPLGALLIIAVGVIAGTVNTIVGAGSLLTFPTLLFLGYPPLVANVSNTVGLVPGTISGAVGYRRELAGQRVRARPLLIAAALGGVTGACLLLVLPAAAFARIVPVLILIACGLVAIQPRLSAWVLERRARSGVSHVGGGWMATKPQATRINTGTIRANAAAGRMSRRPAPVRPPRPAAMSSGRARVRWPLSSRR